MLTTVVAVMARTVVAAAFALTAIVPAAVFAGVPAGSQAPTSALAAVVEGQALTLQFLQSKYNQILARGLVGMRASKAPGEEHIVGDSTDAAGMHWTKCTNLALDMIDTLVAETRGLVSGLKAREHIGKVLDTLGGLRTYHGIFPEIIKIDSGIRAEVTAGRIRYSSIDSAWVTLALTLVQARYERSDGAPDASAIEVANRAHALIAKQDYGVFVGPDGLLGAGAWVDAGTYQKVGDFGFSYGDRNSEARPLVLALVGMGLLPPSAWDNMRMTWVLKEGVPLLQGWRWSAFVEMTGELWLDEMSVAPLSLGRSHTRYIEATTRVARRLGHALWGYAPACDTQGGYAEYGLDRPDLVSPYAAALLATTGDARATANLGRVLAALPTDGRPVPDGLDPNTGRVACAVARTLDQSLLFLSLNVDVVRALARRAPWYASAEQRTRELDRSSPPPLTLGAAEPAPPRGLVPAPTINEPAFPRAEPPAPPINPLPDQPTGPAQTDVPNPDVLVSAERLDALLGAVRRSPALAGGPAALAKSQFDLVSAGTTRAWMDFAPDLGAIVRHPLNGSLTEPTWRTILQARAVLSLEKTWAAVAAGDAKDAARASLRQADRDDRLQAVERIFALYLAERQVRLLEEHGASLDALAPGLSTGQTTGSVNDLVLLKSRQSAIDVDIAEAQASRQLALARLRAILPGIAISETGLDPHLDLPQVLQLLGGRTTDFGPVDDGRIVAEIEQQRSLVAKMNSRAPYVPEPRAAAFVDFSRGVVDASAGGVVKQGSAFDQVTGAQVTGAQVTGAQVTGALGLGFVARPGYALARRAQSSALEARASDLDEVRRARKVVIAQAEVRVGASLAAWSIHPDRVADALYRDTGQRLKRAEVDVAALVTASRTWVDVRMSAERVFAAAVAAAVVLLGQGAQPVLAAVATVDARDGPATLSRAEADAIASQALTGAPALRAANAEASRARSEALRVRRDSWHLDFEAGVVYPLHARPAAGSSDTFTPPMTLGSATLATERILAPSLLGRLSVELESNREQALAAETEADLRAAQAEWVRKNLLVEQAAAWLEVSYARAFAGVAASHANFCAEQLRLARQMQAAGLTEDRSSLREIELRARVASERAQSARGALAEAGIRMNRALGRTARAPLAMADTPGELLAWLRGTHYPSLGLAGYRSTLPVKVAELEERRARAQLQSLRQPASAVDVTLQGSDELRGHGYSVGLAVGLRLDPVKNPSRLLEATLAAGDAESRLRAARGEVEAERRLVRLQLQAAARAHDLETESRRGLLALRGELEQDQAMRPDLHESSKARSLAALEERLQQAELRSIETSARLARAELAALELDVSSEDMAPPPAASPTATLRAAVDRLVESRAEVVSAGAAAGAVALEREHEGPGLLAGFHLAGPIVGASYGMGRSSDGAPAISTRDAGSYLLAGTTYALDRGLSFTSADAEVRLAQATVETVRSRAEAGALAEIGRVWKARERRRLAGTRASDQRRRLDSLAVPRYHAAQISAEMLAEAQVAASRAEAELLQAESALIEERASLAARGVTLSDDTLDEYARLAAPGAAPPPREVLATSEAVELRSGPEISDARERRRLARAETLLAFSRLVGPTTLSLELDAQARRTSPSPLAGGQSETERRLAWVASLFVPLRIEAIGEGAEAASRADLRQVELAARERALRESSAETRVRLAGARDAWRVAERGWRDANLALGEVNGRYRGASAGATVDSLARAENEVLDAEHREREARADLMAVLAPIRWRLRSDGATRSSDH